MLRSRWDANSVHVMHKMKSWSVEVYGFHYTSVAFIFVKSFVFLQVRGGIALIFTSCNGRAGALTIFVGSANSIARE